MIDKKITLNDLKKKAPKGEFLAYINKEEAAALKRAGGSGHLVNGIPSFVGSDYSGDKDSKGNVGTNTSGYQGGNRGIGGYQGSTGETNKTVAEGGSGSGNFTNPQAATDKLNEDIKERERARVKESILNSTVNKFAPTVTKPKGWWDYTKQFLGIASFLNPNTTIAKAGELINLYDTAKGVSKFAEKMNITDKNILESITSNLSDNFTGFSTTSKGPKDPPRDGGDDDNQQNALLSEYLLLLNKGLLSAEEQGRFNSLKSRLGKADGGIMNVNMNKGQLGETLYG